FCDNYLEIVKDRLYNADNYSGEEVASAKYALYNCLLGILKMFAPFVPHITEETYQLFFAKEESKKSIHNSEWPVENKEWENKNALESGDAAIAVISAIRIYKTKKQLSPNAPLKEVVVSEKLKSVLEPVAGAVQCAMKVENVSFSDVKEVTEEFEFGDGMYGIKVQ
ncbi:MAG: class I tRNA ligase family protein, partial [Candidatus Aenigmarchaeota archaeon]|nr:class I tRNA ligase family protein [Candidatus Aenigmarchaeota archaeon]